MPITKQATNPFTRVPHPKEDDSTTYESKLTTVELTQVVLLQN